MTTPTPDTIKAALSYIPALLPRDEWARVGMSIKSEFPDEVGFDLFDGWSRGAGEGYSLKSTRDTWKSIKAGGGVTIATLIHLAKENGYQPPKPDKPTPPPDPATLERLKQERAQRGQAEKEEREALQRLAAEEAPALWDSASVQGDSPYLTRKGVGAHGVRFTDDRVLLVPLRDVDGMLWNVQKIHPKKPTQGTDKFLLKNARKSGLWHILGAVAPSAPVVLLAEGYATAASLHEATGYPTIVAFDAGNLSAVVRALRPQYPDALFVVCGDNDARTAARTGHNSGKEKAEAAARLVGGLSVLPDGLPLDADGLPTGKDFNDLHQQKGLEAVAAVVHQAIDAHQAQHATPPSKATKTRQKLTKPTASNVGAGGDGGGNGANGGNAGKAGEDAPPDWDRFSVTDKGVFHRGVDRDGKPTAPEWVCSRLVVEARTQDTDGQNWGYFLSFDDPQGKPKQWAMPARMLAGDGGEYRAVLLGLGLRLSSSPRARNLLTQYIQTREPEDFATCTDRIGWHGTSFVLPHTTITNTDERLVFQSEAAMENTFKTKGTAQQWRDRVASLCRSNSRLVFAVACAFAGPLLRPAGVESGGFHFRGGSSGGKTTALKVAASVYGGSNYLQRWRTTDNALEAIAAQHCDGLLILDELAQVDPKTAGECAYMLANEQSKGRANRSGGLRTRLTWRLLFLSAGELSLADHMAEGMKRTRTGQEVRMADIPADCELGMGAFECLHSFEDGAEFSRALVTLSGNCYGAVGREWLQYLVNHADTLKARIKQSALILVRQFVPEAASG